MQHTSFTALATRRYARAVTRPRSGRLWRALAIRLHCAAAVHTSRSEHGYATFCRDRARDCEHRAELARLRCLPV